MISESNLTRENLYCLFAIAFFIWRAQSDIRHVTTSPLTVSESCNIRLAACLMSTGRSVDIHRIGGNLAVCFHDLPSSLYADLSATRLFVGLTFFVYVGDPTISLAFVYIASFVPFPSINF